LKRRLRLPNPSNHGIVRIVKKLILIVLMFLLPVQYSWSAAAVYCQHESGSTLHFGHHAHEHKEKPDQKSGHDKLKKADNDCEYCHIFYHPCLASAAPRVAPPEGLGHAELGRTIFSSHIPSRPPKPNWRLVA
jgi:hypothetical protein